MNAIDPTAVLTGDVVLGEGNFVGAGAVLRGPIMIGDGNYFGPYCVVGASPHDDFITPTEHAVVDAGADMRFGSISLGDRNVVREFTTIHRGLTGNTSIGSDCYIMANSTISHDCLLRNHVKVGSGVQTGGYCRFGEGVYLGLSSSFHQFTTIGAFSIVGMGSVVVSAIPPGSKAYGVPARVQGVNAIALERAGVPLPNGIGSDDDLERLLSGTPLEYAFEDFSDDLIACRQLRDLATHFRSQTRR